MYVCVCVCVGGLAGVVLTMVMFQVGMRVVGNVAGWLAVSPCVALLIWVFVVFCVCLLASFVFAADIGSCFFNCYISLSMSMPGFYLFVCLSLPSLPCQRVAMVF